MAIVFTAKYRVQATGLLYESYASSPETREEDRFKHTSSKVKVRASQYAAIAPVSPTRLSPRDVCLT